MRRIENENGQDSWTASRDGVTVTGSTEEDLRKKLEAHVLAPHGSGAKAKLRRTWRITIVRDDMGGAGKDDGDDDDPMIGFSLFND